MRDFALLLELIEGIVDNLGASGQSKENLPFWRTRELCLPYHKRERATSPLFLKLINIKTHYALRLQKLAGQQQ